MEAVEATLSVPLVATPGRALAARALLAGPDGSQQRVSDLLGVSRRTIGRIADAECSTGLRDPQVLEEARTCLAETASRGSTPEEREAAVAGLEDAARDERQVARVQASRRPAARRPRPVRRHGGSTSEASTTKNRPETVGAHGSGSATPTAPPAPAPLTQVDALRRQQQRILHRSALIAYVLATEKRGGQPLTLGDALTDLLADITEAAGTIGTILQTATGRP